MDVFSREFRGLITEGVQHLADMNEYAQGCGYFSAYERISGKLKIAFEVGVCHEEEWKKLDHLSFDGARRLISDLPRDLASSWSRNLRRAVIGQPTFDKPWGQRAGAISIFPENLVLSLSFLSPELGEEEDLAGEAVMLWVAVTAGLMPFETALMAVRPSSNLFFEMMPWSVRATGC